MIVGFAQLAAAALAVVAPAAQPLATSSQPATSQPAPAHTDGAKAAARVKPDRAAGPDAFFTPTEVSSTGSVAVGGRRIAYHATAGTIVVHAKDWSDTDWIEAKAAGDSSTSGDDKDSDEPKPESSMFYAAYFRDGAALATRPITFLFNGGPGSSSVWLHMGAFGPVRVQTVDHGATGAPYSVVPNGQTLLDSSDLVFIDAPGTGFSRIAGKDKEKAFYGVDQDIDAFAQFISQFLSKYGRWSSPKYVFGESYGTMRGAGLTLALQQRDIDLNGLILLSDILSWDLMPDDPQTNPSVDLPYVVALPTYAASAWYHNRIQRPAGPLETFLTQVENFATGDYATALFKGNTLGEAEREAIATRLSAYTGLSVPYLLKSNLRIEYGAFQKELMSDRATTVGTLDTRFSGATIDPLSKVASYDPQSSAISAAYVGAFNDYVRRSLHYGSGIEFKAGIPIYSKWDYRHQPPGASRPQIALPNVLPDLAVAMKQNPRMKVLVNGGYFDVSTPYFAGKYELRHLPVPADIAANIDYAYYESGHMVYAYLPALVAIHDRVAAFIAGTAQAR